MLQWGYLSDLGSGVRKDVEVRVLSAAIVNGVMARVYEACCFSCGTEIGSVAERWQNGGRELAQEKTDCAIQPVSNAPHDALLHCRQLGDGFP